MPRMFSCFLALTTLLMACIAADPISAADWPQQKGPSL